MRVLERGLAVFGVVLALAACDTIPRDALNAYVSAFGEVRTAGVALVNDFAAAKAESERRDRVSKPAAAGASQSEIPLVYTPPAADTAPPSATEARLLALTAIAEYNAALAALAAGESVETVKVATESLGKTAGKIASAAGMAVPELGPLIAAAQELAALAEKARLANEFDTALKAGAPVIRKMLEVMVADTRSHYQLRAALASEDLIDLSSTEKLKRERIKASIDELRKSLDQFVILARKCDRSLVAMVEAEEAAPDFVSSANELITVSMSVKSHWAAYQAARVEGLQ